MLLQVLAGLACILAAVLQYAVHRSPDITSDSVNTMARRTTVAGLMVAGLYILYDLFTKGFASPPFCIASGLVALGQMLFASNNLRKGWSHGIHA